MKEHIDRWLVASTSKFIWDRRSTLKLYIEGQDRSGNEEDYVQMRISGPYTNQYSRKDYLMRVELNFLISSIINETDNHKIFRMCGLVEKALEPAIPVYRYGKDTGGVDTGAYIGCLQRIKAGDQEVITNHWGQVSPDVRVLQSTIEAHYQLDVRLEN